MEGGQVQSFTRCVRNRLTAFGVIAVIAAVAILAQRAGTAGEHLKRSPTSIDPILRHLPLEKERVRPDETPGLDVAPVTDKQTIVLRAYGKEPGNHNELLIVLRVLNEFFHRASTKASEVFGLNLLVKYPSMTRFTELPDSCRGWCEGKMMVSLDNRSAISKSVAQIRAERLRTDMVRQAAMDYPHISYTPRTPPPDYDEAYDVVYNKRGEGGRLREYFFRKGSDGQFIEFVECHPKVPSPACTFHIVLPAQPALAIDYTHSLEFWPQRRDVQGAVVRLIDSFYDRANTR